MFLQYKHFFIKRDDIAVSYYNYTKKTFLVSQNRQGTEV